MIRPWYRSRLFWFGSLGLVCLVWAWLDSAAESTGVCWKGTREVLTVSQGGGKLTVKWDSAIGGRWNDSGVQAYRSPDRNPVFPKGWEFSRWYSYGANRSWPDYVTSQVAIGYWVLLVLYLFVWLGALLAWQRRKSRLLKHAASV